MCDRTRARAGNGWAVLATLCMVLLLSGCAQASERWPGPEIDGFHCVAFDDCGRPLRQRHLVTGQNYHFQASMIPADVMPLDHPARDIVYGGRVVFDYRGLMANARYKLRITYLSDHPQMSFPARVVQLAADGVVLQKKVVLPEDKVAQYVLDIPGKLVADGRLIIEIKKLSGNNAVASALELFSTDAKGIADVVPAQVFDHNMVLQRNRLLPVWGWAEPAQKVTVSIAGQKASATANKQGEWRVTLKPMKAGGPHTMTITGKQTLTLNNILVGEVWVCSGQSNAGMSLGRIKEGSGYSGVLDADRLVKEADQHRNIRVFNTQLVWAATPLKKVQAEWVVCSSKTVAPLSAVGYLFARELSAELKVPVGVIVAAAGGSPIENWIPGPSAVWFNGSLHPCIPYAIRGAIWYQGETNLAAGMGYRNRLESLVTGWRGLWGQGQFPFYIVQVAPYEYRPGGWPAANATPDMLPKLWEAQAAAVRTIPNTGLAVTTDVGDLKDIHPRNKLPVAKRLARLALAQTYGRRGLVANGPVFHHYEIRGGQVTLHFDHVGGGLKSRDGKALDWFEIAGADKKFVKAMAEISGETVVVSSGEVTAPRAVRFGWDQTAQPNLINAEGLPALPFRTDNW